MSRPKGGQGIDIDLYTGPGFKGTGRVYGTLSPKQQALNSKLNPKP